MSEPIEADEFREGMNAVRGFHEKWKNLGQSLWALAAGVILIVFLIGKWWANYEQDQSATKEARSEFGSKIDALQTIVTAQHELTVLQSQRLDQEEKRLERLEDRKP